MYNAEAYIALKNTYILHEKYTRKDNNIEMKNSRLNMNNKIMKAKIAIWGLRNSRNKKYKVFLSTRQCHQV